jgi:very-short-patch-repair endonuclease
MQNTFTKKRVLNKEEVNIYYKLIKIISSLSTGYKLSTQVSLGEILSHSDYSVYRTINTQRADFVIIDKDFYPVLVVEYNGVGHFKGDYKSRDTRKKEALNSAAIEVVVITNDKFNDDTNIKLDLVQKILNKK